MMHDHAMVCSVAKSSGKAEQVSKVNLEDDSCTTANCSPQLTFTASPEWSRQASDMSALGEAIDFELNGYVQEVLRGESSLEPCLVLTGSTAEGDCDGSTVSSDADDDDDSRTARRITLAARRLVAEDEDSGSEAESGALRMGALARRYAVGAAAAQAVHFNFKARVPPGLARAPPGLEVEVEDGAADDASESEDEEVVRRIGLAARRLALGRRADFEDSDSEDEAAARKIGLVCRRFAQGGGPGCIEGFMMLALSGSTAPRICKAARGF
eukprot:CAMPEP_0203870060 /NCGR_PEP_ID=MMETSP0359-20131031/18043_1 /ASSEMBLY_ACC=CAM_ASM_000338 /TAXON_ID=268821 /ORGANISM="Scrippsiella Hangoei, Strain SHTV-5" /LENGTH=269 /DNA_ID=CAMNT_0050788721 /DNA_START=85 /DNA_END=895 /DNA_ORIENTATION=+